MFKRMIAGLVTLLGLGGRDLSVPSDEPAVPVAPGGQIRYLARSGARRTIPASCRGLLPEHPFPSTEALLDIQAKARAKGQIARLMGGPTRHAGQGAAKAARIGRGQ